LSSWKELNILDPSLIVRATEHINDQIELILKLQKKVLLIKLRTMGYIMTLLNLRITQNLQD
jgi:cysteinyl-tRNA synthetase (EC 6.1.1.16)